MDAEIKEKWVEKLRSGEYQQCQNTLYKPASNTYCCLGVLCDILNVDKSYGFFYFQKDFSHPITVDQQRMCIKLNDTDNKNFSEIADYIEANF